MSTAALRLPPPPCPSSLPAPPLLPQVDLASCAGLAGVADAGGCGRARVEEVVKAWRPVDDDK